MDRTILHLDIPAFPVAVERVMDARLRERPVAIAPVGGARPQLLAVSDEARKEGIEVGMFLPLALRRCRDLVVLNPNRRLYRRAGEAFDATEEASTILDRAQGRIYEIAEDTRAGGFQAVDGIVPDTFKSIEEAFQSKDDVTGLRTGFKELDRRLGIV